MSTDRERVVNAMEIRSFVDGLIAGGELAYPVPKDHPARQDMALLRTLIKERGYEIPAWPPLMYDGSHYRLVATKVQPTQK